jgi:hypothetical protein
MCSDIYLHMCSPFYYIVHIKDKDGYWNKIDRKERQKFLRY